MPQENFKHHSAVRQSYADQQTLAELETDSTLKENAESAYQAIEDQIRAVDWSAVSLEDIKPEINMMLEQIEREGTLRSLDWSTLSSRLNSKIKLPATAKTEFIEWLQATWVARVQALRPVAAENAQNISKQLAKKITSYLQHQKKSGLQLEQIADSFTYFVSHSIALLAHPSELTTKTDLDRLVDGPQWMRSLWDIESWQQALEQRKDLTVEEIQQVLNWGEHVWQPKVHQLGLWLQAAQSEIREQLSFPVNSLPDVNLSAVHLPDVNLPSGKPLADVRQKIVEQINLAQKQAKERAIALKEDMQKQADATRRQVAIAAWWLFIALVSSGSAAVGAGWLAAVY